jgi:Phospholipid-translocating P-type ATPase C-terminal
MIYTCIEALCMSIIVLVISAEMVKYSALNIDGHDGGDYTNLSFTVYTIILINISFLVFLNAKHLTLFLLMINLLTTFLPYGVFVFIYDRLVLLNEDTSYSSRFVFSKLIFWLRVLVITVVSIIP